MDIMIQFMINFANNFDADCRDGFVSNDEAYTELAIEGVDLDKKLKKWCKERDLSLSIEGYPYVDMLVDFARHKDRRNESYPKDIPDLSDEFIANIFISNHFTKDKIIKTQK